MEFAQATSEVTDTADRLAGLVADLDLGLVEPAGLADLVAVGERIERLGHGLKTRAAAKVAERDLWRGEGDRSAEDWLARRTGTSRADAARVVSTGRTLDALPVLEGAVRRGEVSGRQAEAIAGAASADPSAEQRLVEQAKGSSLRELQDECRRTRVNADRDPEATAARVHAKRSFRHWVDPDGATGHLQMSGPVATIARAANAVAHRADKRFRTARSEGRREPAEAYAFDAAVDLLTNAGGAAPVPKGADAKIIVRVDLLALLRGKPVEGEVCEIAGIGPIPVATVREWMQDGFLAAVLTEGDEIHKVTHLGRRFTSTQRTALQWQDPVCARRGCSNRFGLEYDHFEDWAATHTSRVDAAKRFCHSCHRLKTIGWTVSPPDEQGQCEFTPPERTDDLRTAVAQAIATRTARTARTARQPQLLDTG